MQQQRTQLQLSDSFDSVSGRMHCTSNYLTHSCNSNVSEWRSFTLDKRSFVFEAQKKPDDGPLAGHVAIEHHAISDQQVEMQTEWFRAHANSRWQLNQSKLAWCNSNLLSRWSPRQNTDTVPLIIIIMRLVEIILQSPLEALWHVTRFCALETISEQTR